MSPFLTSHLASVPSSMVGDRAGIRMSAWPSAQRRLQLSVECRSRARRRRAPDCSVAKSAASVTIVADVLVDRLQLVLAGDASLSAGRGLHLLDRVVLLAHLLHLFAWCGTSPGRTSSGRDSGRSCISRMYGPLPARHMLHRPVAGFAAPPARPCRPPARRECRRLSPRSREIGLGRGARDRRCPWRSGCSRSRR